MKKLLMTTAVLLAMSGSAFAQNANAIAGASATSGSQSQAASSSQSITGNSTSAVFIDQRTPGETTSNINYNSRVSGTTTQNTNATVRERQSGTVRNEFAPAVSAPAMGSGHPCGLGNSIGVSIIGGGVTGGATRVDDACLLAQMGKTTAAMAMIAARSPSACAALVASGDISPDSNCGDGRRAAGGIYSRSGSTGPARDGGNGTPSARPATNAGNLAPVLSVASRNPVCHLKPGTTRTIITSATTPQARMACAASLGLQ